jgi:hypothetical protein
MTLHQPQIHQNFTLLGQPKLKPEVHTGFASYLVDTLQPVLMRGLEELILLYCIFDAHLLQSRHGSLEHLAERAIEGTSILVSALLARPRKPAVVRFEKEVFLRRLGSCPMLLGLLVLQQLVGRHKGVVHFSSEHLLDPFVVVLSPQTLHVVPLDNFQNLLVDFLAFVDFDDPERRGPNVQRNCFPEPGVHFDFPQPDSTERVGSDHSGYQVSSGRTHSLWNDVFGLWVINICYFRFYDRARIRPPLRRAGLPPAEYTI